MGTPKWATGGQGEIGGSGIAASRVYQDAHQSADTDQGDDSIHHTLGYSPFQSARGSALQDTKNDLSNFQASFTTGWISLALVGGWAHFGIGYSAPRYTYRGGKVSITGLISGGALGTFASIPAELAPASTLLFLGTSDAGIAYIDVNPDGSLDIRAYDAGGSNVFVSLDLVEFYEDQG